MKYNTVCISELVFVKDCKTIHKIPPKIWIELQR